MATEAKSAYTNLIGMLIGWKAGNFRRARLKLAITQRANKCEKNKKPMVFAAVCATPLPAQRLALILGIQPFL